MPGKTCRRVTIRLYNPELIEMIDRVPRGLRSAVIQAALAAYRESETHCTFFRSLGFGGNLTRQTITPDSLGEGDLFTQLTGDF